MPIMEDRADISYPYKFYSVLTPAQLLLRIGLVSVPDPNYPSTDRILILEAIRAGVGLGMGPRLTFTSYKSSEAIKPNNQSTFGEKESHNYTIRTK